jgi:hypothetical protein
MDPRSFDALSKVETEYFWFVVRNDSLSVLQTSSFRRRAGF